MNPEQKTMITRGHPLLDEQLAAGLRGDFQRGKEISEELKKITPDCNRAKFNRAWYEMMSGRLLEGLSCLDAGRWEQTFGDPPLPTSKPIYHNEDLRGKYLLLSGEGGLGDEIINARFAKNFADRGAKVILTCDPGLASVFSRVEGISSVIGKRRTPEIYHDYWVPAMSAARVLETEFSDLTGEPYLTVHPDFDLKWKTYFTNRYSAKSRPRIGLRFYGNAKFEHEQHRRFPQEDLIHSIGDRPWVSLQKEDTDLPIENWEDTLAVINQLDLVITSCTSVAHAAAGLGKPTWIITPVLPYYIWALPGQSSPWYKSVKLFRQEKYGNWDNVFAEIKREISRWG